MTDETPPKDLIPLAHKDAPFIYFEGVPSFGINGGVASITLEAVRYNLVDGIVVKDRAVVPYVRCGVAALAQVKQAIGGI